MSLKMSLIFVLLLLTQIVWSSPIKRDTSVLCQNITVDDLFNGKDESICDYCSPSLRTVCYLNISFLSNQSKGWNKSFITYLKKDKVNIFENCSVYKDYYNGETNSNDISRSNNCKNYLKTLMKKINGSSPRCLYDNVFKSQNYAICV